MNSRAVTKLFGLNHRLQVRDYYGGVVDRSNLDKKYRAMLRYYFGFRVEPGDVIFVTLLRHPEKVRVGRK